VGCDDGKIPIAWKSYVLSFRRLEVVMVDGGSVGGSVLTIINCLTFRIVIESAGNFGDIDWTIANLIPNDVFTDNKISSALMLYNS